MLLLVVLVVCECVSVWLYVGGVGSVSVCGVCGGRGVI